jgi:hypothetical protein
MFVPQLEEKSIELEGTRARVRVLEKHQMKSSATSSTVTTLKNCTNSDETLLNSSSTESAHDVGSPLRTVSTPEKPPEPPKRHHSRTTTIKGKKPSRIPLPPPKAFSAPSKAPTSTTKNSSPSPSSFSLQGRTTLRKSNDSPLANNSLQNNLKSSRESISSRSKDSLKCKESVAAATSNKLTLPRKNATVSRPTSSPSGRPLNNSVSKTAGMLEVDSTKVRNSNTSTGKVSSFWGHWWKILDGP